MIILIVDDEPLAAQSLSRTVRKIFGPAVRIITAEDGGQALRAVENAPVDLAFVDIEMPGMSGFELVDRLQERRKATNIVLVTAFREYSLDAWKLHVSDYLLKPASEQDVRAALAHLRRPFPSVGQPSEDKLRVQCFGNFEVFCRGEKIHFTRSGAKELFAYLVSRRGAGVSTGELCSALWEDDLDPSLKKSYIRTYFSCLKKTFAAYGMEDALSHVRDSYSVNTDLLDCDYYRFLEMDPVAINSYTGEFMHQYSWAEPLTWQIETQAAEGVPVEDGEQA